MSGGFVIAIDGPAASGKGTIAEDLGRVFGFPVLDSGLLYRAVGVNVLRGGGDPADSAAAEAAARALDPGDLGDSAYRTREAGEAASVVAAHPGVRAALKAFQRSFAAQEPGAVIDGRDIGTVVCPDAPAKLFVDAAPEVRAHRRWLELKGYGQAPDEAQILKEIRERDERDSNRAISPQKPAADAALLDTSHLGIDAAFAAALALVQPKIEALRARPRG